MLKFPLEASIPQYILAGWSQRFRDIRFWIIILFIVRLYGITNPPLEGASTWRQCDGLMIARNFYETNNNLLYPTVDVAGDKTGIVGSEFPIYNYLIYLVSLVFGFQDWYGRLINLLISSIGTFYFFRSIKQYFSEPTAFYSSIVILVSLWYGYSRITIPDTFAASLCIISIYYALRYFESGKSIDFIVFLFFGLIGCLAKISASTLLTVLAVPMLSKNYSFRRKAWITVAAIIILGAVILWYFNWVPYLNTTYGFPGHFFMGQKIQDGINQLIEQWPITLKRFYDTPIKYSGFIIFVASLIVAIKKRMTVNLAVFCIPFLSFFYFVLVSGWAFTVNSYYPLMFVPSMAFMVGTGLAEIKNPKWVYIILVIISAEGIGNQIHLFQIGDSMRPYTKLESIMTDSGSKRKDLIAINADYNHNPTPMYFAHRKGWNLTNEQLLSPGTLNYLRENNCKFVLVVKVIFGTKIELPLELVYTSNEFDVYKL